MGVVSRLKCDQKPPDGATFALRGQATAVEARTAVERACPSCSRAFTYSMRDSSARPPVTAVRVVHADGGGHGATIEYADQHVDIFELDEGGLS